MFTKEKAAGPSVVPAAATAETRSAWEYSRKLAPCQARQNPDPNRARSLFSRHNPDLDGISALGSLIPIEPNGKTPLVQWTRFRTRSPTSDEIARWNERWPHCNWGVIPARELLVLDVDSADGLAWLRKHGIPVTPISKTARGRHIWIRKPKELRGELPHVLARGVEIVKTFALIPPSTHPSGARYEWLISPLEVEPAPCPEWLVAKLKRAARRAKSRTPTGAGVPRRGKLASEEIPTNGTGFSPQKPGLTRAATPGTETFPRGLAELLNEVVPHAESVDSNCPLQLAAAIVGYRIDRLAGEELYAAVSAVNALLPMEWRVSAGRIRAICESTERAGYGYSARVLSERTGIPIERAKLVYALVSRFLRRERETERKRLSSQEVTVRIMRAVLEHGLRIGDVVILPAKTGDIAIWAGIPLRTLRSRIERGKLGPGMAALRGRRGSGGRTTVVFQVRASARKIGASLSEPSNTRNAIKRERVLGGEGLVVMVGGRCVLGRGPP